MCSIEIQGKLAPSILAADFTRLGEEVRVADEAGADLIHIDVMDGSFVPSISFGMPIVKAVRAVTQKPLDVHLMIRKPERYLEEFAACGADILTVHVEACQDLEQTIKKIKKLGLRAGVTLNPTTPIEAIQSVLNQVDMILIMTVNPGFGGQKYIESTTDKIKELRRLLNDMNLNTDIEVDGGITPDNVSVVLEAGANVIVSGTSVFRGDIRENIAGFRRQFERGRSI